MIPCCNRRLTPPKDEWARFYMSTYLLDAICEQQQFPGMKQRWTPRKTVVYIYCKLFSECSFRGVILQLLEHFVIPVYRMIFEQDPACMSQVMMEALVKREYWYASTLGTFIQMYNVEKALHVLPNISTEKMVMQEVAYRISTRLSTGFHRKKKAPWPMLPCELGCMRSGV